MGLNSLKRLNDAFCFLFEAAMPFCLMSMMPKRRLARETGFSLNLYLSVNSSVTSLLYRIEGQLDSPATSSGWFDAESLASCL